MNNQDRALDKLKKSQQAIDRLDAQLGGEILDAYNKARESLIAKLAEAFAKLGDNPTPAQIRGLMTNVALINAIERRIDELTEELMDMVESGITLVTKTSVASISAEVKLLAVTLGLELTPFVIDPLLELTIGPAIDQIAGITSQMKVTLTAALRGAFASGQRMSEIVNELYGAESSAFSRGLRSARLAAHRAVSEAENTARQLFLENAKVPGLQKQAIARIDGKTSRTCLRVHGQIQPIDQPFKLTGKGKLANVKQTPPFHWGPCRTSVAGYHPDFEQTSTLTTADMVAEAKKQMEENSR